MSIWYCRPTASPSPAWASGSTSSSSKRLEEIYELVAGGHDDIVQISQHATWRYPDWKSWPLDQKYFSMGETLAHLIYLVREGRILQGICGHEYYFRMPYDRKNLALAPGRLASA